MLSIITSLYKSERFLNAFLHKAKIVSNELAQKSIAHEFLLISNDISDIEQQIINDAKLNVHFKLVKVPRETLYTTWNRGVDMASFNYCTFWNVDDTRNSRALIEGLHILEQNNSLVYFPFIYKRYIKVLGVNVLAKQRTIQPPLFDPQTFSQQMHMGPFFMFSKDFYKKVGPFDPTYKIAGDFEWQTRASAIGNLYCSSTVAGIFTNDGTGLSGQRSTTHKSENERIYVNSKTNITFIKDSLSDIFSYPLMDTMHDYTDPEGNVRYYHRLKANRVINFIHAYKSLSKNLMDAGAGRGPYSLLGASVFKKVYCYEYDEQELDIAKQYIKNQNVEFGKVDLTNIPLESNSIDIGICSEVLEHIPDNNLAARELYRVLKPGGKILLSMPNRFSLFYQNVYMKQKAVFNIDPSKLTYAEWEQKRHMEYPYWKIEKIVTDAGFTISRRFGANIIPLPNPIRKILMKKFKRLFYIYVKLELALSSLLPRHSSFYFLEITK